MNKMMKISALLAFGIFLMQGHIASAEALIVPDGEPFDMSKIEETASSVSLESLGAAAQAYSLPIFVTIVVLSGFVLLLGLVFKPLKTAAAGMVGMGVLFYVLVNYAPEVVGIALSIAEAGMNILSGNSSK